MPQMSKKQFIEKQGAACKNWRWSFSYVNESRKLVIFTDFSDRQQPYGRFLIASEKWRGRDRGHAESMGNIRRIEKEGYQLFTFPASAKGKGEQGIASFTPGLTRKWLHYENGDWFSLPYNPEDIKALESRFIAWLEKSGRSVKQAKKTAEELRLKRRQQSDGQLAYREICEAIQASTVYSIQTPERYRELSRKIDAAIESIRERGNREGLRARKAKIRAALNRYEEFLQALSDSESSSAAEGMSEGDSAPEAPPIAEEIDEQEAEGLTEGAKKAIIVNAYERNAEAREQCIAHHGCRCAVCDFDFARVYGEPGSGYIHVHHIKPLAEIGQEYQVDPIKDLIPVCPNCHAMIHRYKEALEIDELKAIMRQQRQSD